MWWQIETGVVGQDGIIRTTPPHNSLEVTGLLTAGYFSADGGATLNISSGVRDDANQISKTLAAASLGSGVGFAGIVSVAGGLKFGVPADTDIELIHIPLVDLPIRTQLGTRLKSGEVAKIVIKNQSNTSASEASQVPVITEAEFLFCSEEFCPGNDNFPTIRLKGERFTFSSDPTVDQPIQDLMLRLTMLNGGDVASKELTADDLLVKHSNTTELVYKFPAEFIVGLTTVQLIRPTKIRQLQDGKVTEATELRTSLPVRIKAAADYVFLRYLEVTAMTTMTLRSLGHRMASRGTHRGCGRHTS